MDMEEEPSIVRRNIFCTKCGKSLKDWFEVDDKPYCDSCHFKYFQTKKK